MRKKIIFCLISFILFPIHILAVTKIYFWHSMAGSLENVLNNIVQQFNNSQSEYQIIPVYKGDYTEALTALVAAFRADQQPAIAQVFEVGTATMIYPKGIIVPVFQLMQEAQINLTAKDFLSAVAAYYSDEHGTLLGMPFNSSSAVLYYNKDAFQKAGLNPNKPPTTWPQLIEDSKKLLAAGYSCGFTTTWPSWIQIETFSAWHNVPLATKENGFKGLGARLIFNNPLVIRQIASLVKWQKENVFRYGGREDNALSLFTSGQCVMLFESSGSLGDLQQDVDFHLGTTFIPYWPDIKGAPQNTIIGGAALWALTGFSKNVYKGIAKFFAFLASPKIQVQWQEATGYVPITKAAYQLSKKNGFYRRNPGAEIAIKELSNKPPTAYTRGLRLGNYSEIRQINAEEIEAALTEQKSPQQAMNDAVKRDNRLLQNFQLNIEVSVLIQRIGKYLLLFNPMMAGIIEPFTKTNKV